MPWTPTADDLLDLNGVRRRADRFRFELWQGGQYAGDLSPDAARPPTVKVETSRASVRTLEGFYLPSGQLVDVNTVADRVRAVMALQDGTEYSLGWFMWGDDSQAIRGWGTERHSTLVDEGYRLDQEIDRTIGFAKGTNTLDMAAYLASQVIGADRIIIGFDSAALTTPPSFAIGTNRYQVMAELLASIGFLPPYFDRDNYLVLREAPDLTGDDLPAPTLTYNAGPRIVADSIVPSDLLLTAPNRYVVYESSGQGPAIAGSYNIADSAPHSIASRNGVVVPKTVSQTGLGSVAQANKAAKTLAQTDTEVFRLISWQSPADPRHDVWDRVTFLEEDWLETSWSIVCKSGGLMTHEARRVW